MRNQYSRSPAHHDRAPVPMSSSSPAPPFNGSSMGAAYRPGVKSRSSSVRSFNSFAQRLENPSRTGSPMPLLPSMPPPPPQHPPPAPHQHQQQQQIQPPFNQSSQPPQRLPWPASNSNNNSNNDPNASSAPSMPAFRPMPMPEAVRPPSSFVRIEKWLNQTEIPNNSEPPLSPTVIADKEPMTTTSQPAVKEDTPKQSHVEEYSAQHHDQHKGSYQPQSYTGPPDAMPSRNYQNQDNTYNNNNNGNNNNNNRRLTMEAPRPSMNPKRPSFDQRPSMDHNRPPYDGRSEYGTPPQPNALMPYPTASSSRQPSPGPNMQLNISSPPQPIQTANLSTMHGPSSPHSYHSGHSQHSHPSPPLPHHQSPNNRPIANPVSPPPAYPLSPTTSGNGGVNGQHRSPDRPNAAVHPTHNKYTGYPEAIEMTAAPTSPQSSRYAPYIDYNNQPCPGGGVHDFAREWKFFDYLCVGLFCPCYCAILCLKSIMCSCTTEGPEIAGDRVCGCGASGPKICQKCGIRHDDMLAGRVRRHRLQ
ncbi:hypothetical protein BDF19DRAFT_273013 [Syncephalis fuscata]|nr:hypothetical protein BDF19DRAFT_273013 [Syncephalis fuscata]